MDDMFYTAGHVSFFFEGDKGDSGLEGPSGLKGKPGE